MDGTCEQDQTRAHRQDTVLDLADQQQICHQPVLAVGGYHDSPDLIQPLRVAQVRPAPLKQLCVAKHGGERGAQLVADRRDEVAPHRRQILGDARPLPLGGVEARVPECLDHPLAEDGDDLDLPRAVGGRRDATDIE